MNASAPHEKHNNQYDNDSSNRRAVRSHYSECLTKSAEKTRVDQERVENIYRWYIHAGQVA